MGRVGRAALLAALLAALPVTVGCSQKGAVEERGGAGGRDGGGVVRIVFDLPGDDIGAPGDRELLGAVREGLLAAGAGEVVGAEFGMGRMELRLAAAGADLALVRAVLRERAPGSRYRVERSGP